MVDRLLPGGNQDPVKPAAFWLIQVFLMIMQQAVLFNNRKGFSRNSSIICPGKRGRERQSLAAAGDTLTEGGDHAENEGAFVRSLLFHIISNNRCLPIMDVVSFCF